MSKMGQANKRWWRDQRNYVVTCSHWWVREYKHPRKMKRKVITHLDIGPMLPDCPKEWNKRYHIRPNRRKWKALTHRLKTDQEHWYEAVLPLNTNKPHIYYW